MERGEAEGGRDRSVGNGGNFGNDEEEREEGRLKIKKSKEVKREHDFTLESVKTGIDKGT